ncbi:NAD-dependent epimerase/dehydratase family protein [Sphingomonas sp. M1-B02]|uniref:NAD-dependent epimerase/dehydratase family protein n=1 Tax=Sphingomonas sp. M1-B02 TaxID=3114300 RepID=UPI002240316B|nr:NAD-dependent epimerase/dehydratase family protein [Sphingomonas sp. S6-11]UZK65086.1 NAD-dependent epimerase/dehydratase family protein [Sphingomonas sp. S6-11]
MRLAITGAAGFVGRAVVAHLAETRPDVELLLADRAFDTPPRFATLIGELSDPAMIRSLCDGADAVLHLAALPGGAAERNPQASRAINLDVPLTLIEAMEGRRLVIAGSIAVFGAGLPSLVDDATPPAPASVYGTHKRMVELAFADAVRRGAIAGMVLRLPGIVARPPSASGFGSAFLSDIFYAARTGAPYTIPVAPDATSWLMSARTCAANLVAAVLGKDCEREAVTLGALRVRIGDLVAELAKQGDVRRFEFAEDPAMRHMFGSYPLLMTPRADALGFRHDGSLAALVKGALARH